MATVSQMILLSFSPPDVPVIVANGFSTIGDMTGGGGLAKITDGATGATPNSADSGTAANAYCGANFPVAKYIKQVEVWPDTTNGFVSTAASNVTLTLMYKDTLPASATDGTSAGTTGSIADQTTSAVITSTVQDSPHFYWWVIFDGNANAVHRCSEMQFTELL